MTNAQAVASPMVAAEYTLVSPPGINVHDPQSVRDFRTQVTLQAQGDPAIFDARTPQTALALAFAAAYEVATQALMRLEDGRLVLLFDHETRELMPSEEVDETVWAEILKLKNKIVTAQDVAMPIPELSIDLAAAWSRVKEGDDIVARTKLFLKALTPALSPCATLRLRGDIPALPLLAVLYLVRPSAYTVEYADVSGTVVTLFS